MGMTIKEAISWLEELTFHEGEDVPIYDTDIEAINIAIKALKQECIIDKIRAEISKAWYTRPRSRYEQGAKNQALKDMRIIDKYKEEGGE